MALFKCASAVVTWLCKKELKVQPLQFPFLIIPKFVLVSYAPLFASRVFPTLFLKVSHYPFLLCHVCRTKARTE